jgi:hypothetical protein
MDIAKKIEKAMKMEREELRKEFKYYLRSQEIAESTVQTRSTDSFYIWKNVSKDDFWRIIESENFEIEAKDLLYETLSKKSKGDADSLTNGYLSHLRKLREFIFSDDFMLDDVNNEEYIKKFLLDIDCLDALSEWTNKFNLFDILKITRTEIRHSNMLGWLLSPSENHGLGDKILKGFVQYIVENFLNDKDVLSILMKDFYSFEIQREWRNIDIIAKSDKENLVLCIENKIGTSEHDNQLDRYREIIESTYSRYTKIYIYLSPEGEESSSPIFWHRMSYQNVLEIIEKSVKNVELLPEANLLINNYIEIIRRDIVEDQKLADICKKIYYKHQKALELIMKNKPDEISEVADIIKNWVNKKKNVIKYDKIDTKNLIRFRTPEMDNIIPESEEPNSGWKTKNHYFYEITITGKDILNCCIKFVLNSQKCSSEQKEIFEKINELYPVKKTKDDWDYRCHFTTSTFKIETKEINEEKIHEKLDKELQEIFAFQQDFMSKIKI